MSETERPTAKKQMHVDINGAAIDYTVDPGVGLITFNNPPRELIGEIIAAIAKNSLTNVGSIKEEVEAALNAGARQDLYRTFGDDKVTLRIHPDGLPTDPNTTVQIRVTNNNGLHYFTESVESTATALDSVKREQETRDDF